MANTKVSALTDLASTPATGDKILVVDVSDTTMGASGTTKFVTANYFLKTNSSNALVGNLNVNSNNITNVGTVTATTANVTTNISDGNGWQNLTFASGWANFGSGYNNGQYKKVGDLVFLRGLVKRTSGSSATIATLASGYRPSGRCVNKVLTSAGAGTDQVDVKTTGNIDLESGGVTFVQLDGIVFSTL